MTALIGLLCLMSAHEALAQTGKPKKPPASVEKTTSLYSGATIRGRETALEGDLNLTFQGNAATAGTLDACVSTDSSSAVSDRIRTPLTVKGDAITAAGTTEFGKAPFELSLRKTGGADTIALKGTLVVAGVRVDLDAQDIELQPYEKPDESGEEPPAASVPSFNAVSIRTPLDKIRPVLQQLRAEQAEVSLNGLIPTCADLRAGFSLLDATLPPGKVPGLIDRLNAVQGVRATMADVLDQSMTVRLSGAQAGTADKDIVAAVTQAVVAATGGQQVGTTSADPRTGEYGVDVQRETVLSKRLGLTEQLSTKFVIGRKAADRTTYVNLFAMTSRLIDPAPDNKLALPDDTDIAEDGGPQTGVNTTALDRTILQTVAERLKGQTWDGEADAWK